MKKFLGFLVVGLLSCNISFAMSEAYEKTIYNGCYPNAKQYLGAERAKQQYTCTIKMLSKKYTNEDMDSISQKSEEYQLKAFSFASTHCNNYANTL